jgi:hypothetical protein
MLLPLSPPVRSAGRRRSISADSNSPKFNSSPKHHRKGRSRSLHRAKKERSTDLRILEPFTRLTKKLSTFILDQVEEPEELNDESHDLGYISLITIYSIRYVFILAIMRNLSFVSRGIILGLPVLALLHLILHLVYSPYYLSISLGPGYRDLPPTLMD